LFVVPAKARMTVANPSRFVQLSDELFPISATLVNVRGMSVPACKSTPPVESCGHLARVDVAGVQRTVNVGLLDSDGGGARPGDWVLIHVGFAISVIDEEEARATRELLEAMGAEYEQELHELRASVIE